MRNRKPSLRERDTDCVPNPDALAAPDYTKSDVYAFRALQAGNANESQQKQALTFIINKICGTYDSAFRPGPSDRETNIALGKQRVGQHIVYYLNSAPTQTDAELKKAGITGAKEHG